MNMRSRFTKSLLSVMLWGGMAFGSNVYADGIDLNRRGNDYGIVSQLQMKLGKTFTGRLFIVDSGHTLARDAASSGSFKTPYATLDYAIGRAGTPSATGPNNGNLILVMPGHAETLIADSGVDVDVAGLTIAGVGDGEDRPIFTFATAATADFKLAAANLTIHNLVFKCNIASHAMMIETSGDDCEISHCEFREGTATGLTFISVGLADGDSDRAWIHGCTFQATTAGNYDDAITVLFDMNGIVIEDCHIHGDFDVAGIGIPTAGNAQVDMLIRNCDITNLLTGQHAIEIIGTASTGKIIGCDIVTDAVATSIDAGGLEMFNCLFNIGTDQGGAVPIPQDATFSSLLGYKVLKADANLPQSTTETAFTIAGGRVLITRLTAEIGTVVETQACNLSVIINPTTGTSGTVASTLDITATEAGGIGIVEGDGTAFIMIDAGTTWAAAGNGFQPFEANIGSIDVLTSASNTGTIKWEIWYIPLETGAVVTSG